MLMNTKKTDSNMDIIQADITDLKMELWLRRREEGKIVWKTKNGDNIPINKMGTTHIVNAISRSDQYDNDNWEALADWFEG